MMEADIAFKTRQVYLGLLIAHARLDAARASEADALAARLGLELAHAELNQLLDRPGRCPKDLGPVEGSLDGIARSLRAKPLWLQPEGSGLTPRDPIPGGRAP